MFVKPGPGRWAQADLLGSLTEPLRLIGKLRVPVKGLG